MLFLISAVALSTEFAGKFNKSIGARLGFCSGDSKQLNWSHKKRNTGEGQTCELKKCFGGDSACMVESEGKRAISTISESNY